MRMTFTSTTASKRIEKIQQLLCEKGMTVSELRTEIHLTPRWVRAYLKYLQEKKQVYITAWRRTTEDKKDYPIPVYRWGSARNARKPAPKPSVLRQQILRKKLVADPASHASHLAMRRAKRLKPYRDWASSWIPTRRPDEEVQA